MTNMAEWAISRLDQLPGPDERLFFNDHEWETIEAATARIIPTDQDPGAREAGVVRFIDRYLSGINYIWAAADGSGFLQLAGKHAESWRVRIARFQQLYRDGIREVDSLARSQSGADFKDLEDAQQDAVLESLSGELKPSPLSREPDASGGAFQMGAFDDHGTFFPALVAHTRQGFYSDPIYGGNRDGIGWKVIGFPGPKSLKDTMDGTYSLREYYVQEYDWNDLVPQLNVARDDHK